MSEFQQALAYALEPRNLTRLSAALSRHGQLVASAMAIALLLGLPFGWWSSRSRIISALAINTTNILRVIPSLAILFLFVAIPGYGLSIRSAIVALTILALPPILINTNAAFRTLNPAVREAAKAMGMPAWLQLWRVELPLAAPVILSGIRIALVEVIASATLAAFIGAGGLGSFITLGFSMSRVDILLVGAIPVALLAIVAEIVMAGLLRWVRPPQF
ncbi:ABC transporter permease [Herpetosiphon llansteffanensis]